VVDTPYPNNISGKYGPGRRWGNDQATTEEVDTCFDFHEKPNERNISKRKETAPCFDDGTDGLSLMGRGH